MGRTNKLVDGCYSFWQGGIFPLLTMLMPDYLAQTRIPHMASPSTAARDSPHHSGSGHAAASGGSAAGSSGHASASSGHASFSTSKAAFGRDVATVAAESQSRAAGIEHLTGAVLGLQGKDPVVRGLDDLHRTKVMQMAFKYPCQVDSVHQALSPAAKPPSFSRDMLLMVRVMPPAPVLPHTAKMRNSS